MHGGARGSGPPRAHGTVAMRGDRGTLCPLQRLSAHSGIDAQMAASVTIRSEVVREGPRSAEPPFRKERPFGSAASTDGNGEDGRSGGLPLGATFESAEAGRRINRTR